ncbi:MAG TPA: hypothetical protein VK625_19645 [Flavitalea sp.]|nr:hypothetical protein [Flavitalea sp.]
MQRDKKTPVPVNEWLAKPFKAWNDPALGRVLYYPEYIRAQLRQNLCIPEQVRKEHYQAKESKGD